MNFVGSAARPRTLSICWVARFAATTRLRVLPETTIAFSNKQRGTQHRDDEHRDRDNDFDDRETVRRL